MFLLYIVIHKSLDLCKIPLGFLYTAYCKKTILYKYALDEGGYAKNLVRQDEAVF